MSDSESPASAAPVESADDFLELAQASGLVPAQHRATLQAALAAWRAAPGPMPDACRQAIIDGGLLTEWHVRKLLKRAGRDNFFLDAFKLLKPLGHGGMGSVFLAEYTDPDRKTHRVAIKLLPKRLQEKGQYLNRFQQENWVAARLKHEHIARAWDDFGDSNEDTPYHYSVMEYIEGEDLDRLVRNRGPLAAQAAVEYIQQAAKGLQYAHDHGLVHRDIKPANLIVDAAGHVKILDFGLVQTEDEDDQSKVLKADERKKSLGTPDYMSPEQASAKTVDHRSDIYSLGCTLYFLLTGHAPYDHVQGDPGGKGTRIARMEAHVRTSAPNLLDKRPNVPAKLVDLVQRMMAKSPGDRPQSAQEVDDALFMMLQGYELEEFDQKESVAAAASGAPARPSSGMLSNASATGTQTTGLRPATGVVARSSVAPGTQHASSAGGSLATRLRAPAPVRQADTPPPSSSARSTGRMPPASLPEGNAGNPPKSSPKPAPQRTLPAVQPPGATAKGGTRTAKDNASTGEESWLLRTVGGLPVIGWLGVALALIGMIVAAALWLI